MKREVTGNVIDADNVNFLCSEETIKGWGCQVDFEDDKLKFIVKDKQVDLAESEGGHHQVT